MKKHCLTSLLLTILALASSAQNVPQAANGPATRPVAPANMGNLAIHFTGKLNKNEPLDMTITAKSTHSSDEMMFVRVNSISQKSNGYLVDYAVYGGGLTTMQGTPNNLHPGIAYSCQVGGTVFLLPGKPLHAAMSDDNDVTLTLTELAQ